MPRSAKNDSKSLKLSNTTSVNEIPSQNKVDTNVNGSEVCMSASGANIFFTVINSCLTKLNYFIIG